MVPYIFYRLKLPMKKNMKYVQNIIKYNYIFIKFFKKKKINIKIIKILIYKLGIETLKDIFLLSYSKLKKKNYKLKKKILKLINNNKKIENLKLSINGNDIIKLLNIKSSKKIGIIKKKIIKYIIINKIKNNSYIIKKFIIKKWKK
ncbi:MAG: hypothetical protein NHF95_00700 [Candidatus Shikimatogenerans sp. JK-2022]|nr:hypothetical protein [Candidatus Shikimatogenerans bostrichidophilus]